MGTETADDTSKCATVPAEDMISHENMSTSYEQKSDIGNGNVEVSKTIDKTAVLDDKLLDGSDLNGNTDAAKRFNDIVGLIRTIGIDDDDLWGTVDYYRQKAINDNNAITTEEEAFKDPPPKEECPICMLPLPYADKICGVGALYYPCCGKRICYGCTIASKDEIEKGNLKAWCVCCRVPCHKSTGEFVERCKKRMELNDAEACYVIGREYHDERGTLVGLPLDFNKAFELWKRGSELGSIRASYELADIYYFGRNGVEKDKKKALHLYNLAAIGGHEIARHILGLLEQESNIDTAIIHWMIAARCGYEDSLKEVGKGYKAGHVTKDDYAKTLRTYQHSRDEMKSEQRAKAAAVVGLTEGIFKYN